MDGDILNRECNSPFIDLHSHKNSETKPVVLDARTHRQMRRPCIVNAILLSLIYIHTRTQKKARCTGCTDTLKDGETLNRECNSPFIDLHSHNNLETKPVVLDAQTRRRMERP